MRLQSLPLHRLLCFKTSTSFRRTLRFHSLSFSPLGFHFLSPLHLHAFRTSSMASSQVGILVPLNKSLEKEKSLPEFPVSEGDNVIGRNNIPVTDKRLSRKHLILSASSSDCYAALRVEGMNPVVINSGDQRKILNSGDKASIKNGDILELIPGSHYFKYLTTNNQRDCDVFSKVNEGGSVHTNFAVVRKRARENLNPGSSEEHMVQHGSGRKLKETPNNVNFESNKQNLSISRSKEEALRHFHVSDDRSALTFRLMKVRGLPEWANTSCVSIDTVIEGDVLVAVLSNYMVDIDWLLSACPMLKKVPQVLVVHGESDGTVEYMKRNKPSNWILHKPPLPISYGTHHSKAMLLLYPRGVRVIVHTANLIHVDWNNKSQGLWMQDFPWKDQNEANKGCPFETDLIDYLQALKLPVFTANLPALGRVTIDPFFFKKFNYGNASVRLIASVPGYHLGSNLKKWGHMKLRSILEQCTFDEEFKRSPLIYQFSSLGSLDEKWMTELRTSMSSGVLADKSPLGLGEPLIIWPSVEDVRCSLEGYAAGNAIPSPLKNVEKGFLNKYWAKWKATHTGRCRSMPHIKTFVRYNGQNLAWFLLTSANLSKAAWGTLQKNNSQLMIRSYELGVLFLPSVVKNGCGFSCTGNKSSLEDTRGSTSNCRNRKIKLVTLTWQGRDNDDDSDSEIVCLPVPYELPPKLYSSEDVPWSWDRKYMQKDVYGQVWPRRVKLYSAQGD